MHPCPLCETPCTPGVAECPTCGHVFAVAAVPDMPAGNMPDLELGREQAVPEVANDAVPELEHLSLIKVGEVAPDQTPDMELTARAPVGEVAADAVPELEQTKVADKEWTPEVEGPVLCRACRTPQTDASSIFCQVCGYRLPVRKLAEAVLILDAGAVAAPTVAPDEIKCPQCGCKTPPGGNCRACGVTLRPISA